MKIICVVYNILPMMYNNGMLASYNVEKGLDDYVYLMLHVFTCTLDKLLDFDCKHAMIKEGVKVVLCAEHTGRIVHISLGFT